MSPGELPLEERVERELLRRPDASVATLAGALQEDPEEIAAALEDDPEPDPAEIAEAVAGPEPERPQREPDPSIDAAIDDALARRDQDEDEDVVDETSAAAFMGGDSPHASDEPLRVDHQPSSTSSIDTGGYSRATSALPIAQLDALSPEERRRAARKRGLDWPSTDEARDELFDTIAEVMRHEDDRVVDAPTSLGKSHTIAATRWGARGELTGNQPVVHLLATKSARDEAIEVAEEEGGTYMVLRSRHEACPVAAGEHDPDQDEEPEEVITIDGEPASEWLDRQCNQTGKGMPFSAAHRHLEKHNDQGVKLPCCRGSRTTYDEGEDDFDDGERPECPAIQQWEKYREGDWPLVIATHNFAYAPGLRSNNNLVVDEEPDFGSDLTTDRIRRAVGAYLREIDAPVSTWEAFVQLARHDSHDTDAATERDAVDDCLDFEPDREWYFQNDDAHILAPALARAIFRSEDRANGRRVGKTVYQPPRLDAAAREDDDWNREWVSVVLDETNEVRSVRVTPDFGAARSVIGLDAYPAMPVWQANTMPWIESTNVLEPTRRHLWRRYERGLRVVQVGDATRPLASGEYFDDRGAEAVLEHLREEHGEELSTAITAKSVKDRLRKLMEHVGIYDAELMHYGDVKSRNDFAGEDVGFVEGCIDPGDGPILDLLAELDLEAEPEAADVCCENCGDRDDDPEEPGDGCPECNGTGMARKHGREFAGEDAQTAKEILAAVRENQVAQAAGRYARNPEDSSDFATVYVRTDAMPPGFADVQVPGAEWVYSSKQESIVEELRDRTAPATTRELAEATDVSKRHVHDTLQRLVENGTVDALEGAGEHGATLYAENGTPTSGVVDLTDEDGEIVNDAVRGPHTWSLSIEDPTLASSADGGDDRGGTTPTEGLFAFVDGDDEGDPPP